MTILSLNQAAKHAGVAKKTMLERLHHQDLSKKLSGEKDERGHWKIDTSELDRVFGEPDTPPVTETTNPPPENGNGNSALSVEVKMLRERIDGMEAERNREREQLSETIEDLRKRLDTEGQERRRLTAEREAVLSPVEGVTMRKGILARLTDAVRGQGTA